MCLDGEALAWYQWEESQQPLKSWEELTKLLLEHFRPSQEGMILEKILALHQETTVREYQRAFEIFPAPLLSLPEGVLVGSFVNGLKPTIRAEVRMLKPQGLGQLMELAQRVEDRDELMEHAQSFFGPIRSNNNPYNPSQIKHWTLPPLQPATENNVDDSVCSDAQIHRRRHWVPTAAGAGQRGDSFQTAYR